MNSWSIKMSVYWDVANTAISKKAIFHSEWNCTMTIIKNISKKCLEIMARFSWKKARLKVNCGLLNCMNYELDQGLLYIGHVGFNKK